MEIIPPEAPKPVVIYKEDTRVGKTYRPVNDTSYSVFMRTKDGFANLSTGWNFLLRDATLHWYEVKAKVVVE